MALMGLILPLLLAVAASEEQQDRTAVVTLDVHTKIYMKKTINLPAILGVTVAALVVTIAAVLCFLRRGCQQGQSHSPKVFPDGA